MADPPVLHGPYWSWTCKVHTKTTTRYLSDEQMADYRAFFENAKALRELVAELEALNLEAIERDPRREVAPDPGHRVGAGRFTCGWPLDHVVEALLTSKREDLTSSARHISAHT